VIFYAGVAFLGGVLVIVSRQINGRLSLSTSAMHASFWNHVVGLIFLSVIAVVVMAFGGPFAQGAQEAPAWAYLGGTIGVIFIAMSSWLVAKIGAVRTAMLIIAGQMVSGVVLDVVMGAPGALWARIFGVILIMAGMWLSMQSKGQEG